MMPAKTADILTRSDDHSIPSNKWSDENPNEAEILERIASLYAQLDELREKRKDDAPSEKSGSVRGPRVVLVTRRLPRDALDHHSPGHKPRLDAMDQAVCNFRQVAAGGRDVIWVGRPETAAHDIAGEERAIRDRLLRERRYAPVFLDAKRERLFYSGFCKRVLWPLFHSSPPTTRDTVARARQQPVQGQFCPFYKGDDDETDDAQQLWSAYGSVNRAYADVVHDVAEEGDLIWIQDYHFMLLPQMLRALDSDAKLGFFLHVPFPSSELYRMLPYREEILHGMLAADLLGFQTYDYARHFLSSCEIILGIETSPDRIEHDGHQTRVCVCPVGIEPDDVRARASHPSTRLAMQRLESQLSGRTLVLGVDTLDPTKGLVHKFLAVEELFNEHPELADQLLFVQVILGGATMTATTDDAYDDRHSKHAEKREAAQASPDDDAVVSDDDTIANLNDHEDFLQGDDFVSSREHGVHQHGNPQLPTSQWRSGTPSTLASSRGPLAAATDAATAEESGRPRQSLFDASSNASSNDSPASTFRHSPHQTNSAPPKERLDRAHRRFYSRGVFTTLERQLHAMVSRINSKLASLDFEGPVQYLSVARPEANEANLAALFSLADILVCTPIRDGMNVVPFEYLVARDEIGKFATVLLSEFAGCARSLGGAVIINPWDTTSFANALHRLVKEARNANAREARRRARKHKLALGGKSMLLESTSNSQGTSAKRPRSNPIESPADLGETSRETKVTKARHATPMLQQASAQRRGGTVAVEVDDDEDEEDDDEEDEEDEEEDDDEDEVVHNIASPATLEDVGRIGQVVPGGSLSGSAAKLPRSSTQRARGVERRRAHDHMLYYVTHFTARSWAARFLQQLQEASETKATRTLCREIKVPHLLARYVKTKRRLIVFALEGVLAKPCALPELLVVPPQTLENLRAICRDNANRMVVIMSGRSAEVLERLFAPILTHGDIPANLVLAAEEGLAIKWSPKLAFEMQVSPFDLDLSWHEDAAPLIEYYTERTPGSVVEEKESGVAWHYRDCDLNHGAWQARQLQVALGELAKHVPLSVFSGDKFIEVRPMRLSVPNVLEAALRRIRERDAAGLRKRPDGARNAEEVEMAAGISFAPPSAPIVPTAKADIAHGSTATTMSDQAQSPMDDMSGDETLSDADRRRGVDYVLFIASGNGLVDEEIFESMAPPPFDLDEFCYRVQKLSAGEKLDEVVDAPAASSALDTGEQVRADAVATSADEQRSPSARPGSLSFKIPLKREERTPHNLSETDASSVPPTSQVGSSEVDTEIDSSVHLHTCSQASDPPQDVPKRSTRHCHDVGAQADISRGHSEHSVQSESVLILDSNEAMLMPREIASEKQSHFAEDVETLPSAPDGTFDGGRIKGTLDVPFENSEHAPRKPRIERLPRQLDISAQMHMQIAEFDMNMSPGNISYEADLGPEAATFEQFAAVMTGPEIDRKKKIPGQVRERLKRKTSSFVEQSGRNTVAPPQISGHPDSQSDSLRRANVAARQNFQPRRDFPPSSMLFQAMRRRYGKDWSRVDLPTTPSACWALVGGRTPRPGAPKAERSTFLADFEDIHGVDSPDIIFPHQEPFETTDPPADNSNVETDFPTHHADASILSIRRVQSVEDYDDENQAISSRGPTARGDVTVSARSAGTFSEAHLPNEGRSILGGYCGTQAVVPSSVISSFHREEAKSQQLLAGLHSLRKREGSEPGLYLSSNARDDSLSRTGAIGEQRSTKAPETDKFSGSSEVRLHRSEPAGFSGLSPTKKKASTRQSRNGAAMLTRALEMNALALSRALKRDPISEDDNMAAQQISRAHHRYPSVTEADVDWSTSTSAGGSSAQRRPHYRRRSQLSIDPVGSRQGAADSHHRSNSWDGSHRSSIQWTSPAPSVHATKEGVQNSQRASAANIATSSLSSQGGPVDAGNLVSADQSTNLGQPPAVHMSTHWMPENRGECYQETPSVTPFSQCGQASMQPQSSEQNVTSYVTSRSTAGASMTSAMRTSEHYEDNVAEVSARPTNLLSQPNVSTDSRKAKKARKRGQDASPSPPSRWRSQSGWGHGSSELSTLALTSTKFDVAQRVSRLRTRTVTPPPPGAAPVYLSYASRGAVTEQERREFDRAARAASAAAKAASQREIVSPAQGASINPVASNAATTLRIFKKSSVDHAGEISGGSGELHSASGMHTSAINSRAMLPYRPGTARFPSQSILEAAEGVGENVDGEQQPNHTSRDNNSGLQQSIVEPIVADKTPSRLEDSAGLNQFDAHSGALAAGNGESTQLSEQTPQYAPVAPEKSGPPPMSSIAAAAAAAAGDSYIGLDLPLQTFSCIVGIKLSQATYYLKSTDMVLTLLDQMAAHSVDTAPSKGCEEDSHQ